MKTVLPIIAILTGSIMATDPTGDPKYVHPLIPKHGGTVELPRAAQQPQKGTKVLLDVAAEERVDGVIKGLDRAALISNQYAAAKLPPGEHFQIAVVLHGKATAACLSQSAYKKHVGKPQNPDWELIRQLKASGVQIFVCGQALAHHGFTTSEVSPEVTIAVSAATVNINLQTEGYAYIPFL